MTVAYRLKVNMMMKMSPIFVTMTDRLKVNLHFWVFFTKSLINNQEIIQKYTSKVPEKSIVKFYSHT